MSKKIMYGAASVIFVAIIVAGLFYPRPPAEEKETPLGNVYFPEITIMGSADNFVSAPFTFFLLFFSGVVAFFVLWFAECMVLTKRFWWFSGYLFVIAFATWAFCLYS